MLCSIFGNIKIVSLPKFELIWTMGSVSRMLLISPNFSLALWPRTNRSGKKPHFLVNGWPIGQFSTWSRPCWWFVNLEFRKSARWKSLYGSKLWICFLIWIALHWRKKFIWLWALKVRHEFPDKAEAFIIKIFTLYSAFVTNAVLK